jgi:hypothetical protein
MAIAATIAVDLVARTEAFASAMKETTDKLKDVGDQMRDIGKSMSLYVTAPIVGGFALATRAADKQAEAEAKLQAVIRATGGAAGVTAEHVMDLAASLQRTTTFGDEATIAGAAVLLTFKSIRNEMGEGNAIFDRTIAVGQDLAALMGGDLQGAMVMLGKAIEDPQRGLTALTRVGLSFDDSQRELIETLIESGNTLDAQRVILQALESQVGGTAQTVARTAGGQMRMAFNDLGDAMERIGRVFDPIRIRLSQGISELARRFQQLPDGVIIAAVAIAGLVAAIGPLLVVTGTLLTSYAKVMTALPAAAQAFRTVQMVISGNVIPAIVKLNAVLLANPIGIVIAALAALAAAFVYVYRNSETFRQIINNLFPSLMEIARALRDGLGGALEWVGNAFVSVFGAITNTISSFVAGTLNFLGGLLPEGVRESMANFGDSMTSGVRRAVDTAKQIISELRGPSLDLGVTGSNAAARDALYSPVMEASAEAGAAIQEAAEAYTSSLIEGARLNTLNSSEVGELIAMQAEYRQQLAQGNLTLAERNRLTTELNTITGATSEALRVNTGELLTSRAAMGLHTNSLQLATIETGEVAATMEHLAQKTSATSGIMQQIGSAGMSKISDFLGQFSPLSIAMEMLGEVFKVLQPIMDALRQPFQIMAQILGRAVIPILKAFWPPIRALAIAMSYVAEILFRVAGGIASAVGGAIAAIGGVIAKIPLLGGVGRSIQARGQDIQAIGAGFTQAGREMKDLREALRDMDLSGVGEEEQTNTLLAEGNKEQAKVAANTQRMADAIETGALKPNMTINVTVSGSEDPRMAGQSIAQAVMEEIDRRLGENSLRDSRFDGMMMAL